MLIGQFFFLLFIFPNVSMSISGLNINGRVLCYGGGEVGGDDVGDDGSGEVGNDGGGEVGDDDG